MMKEPKRRGTSGVMGHHSIVTSSVKRKTDKNKRNDEQQAESYLSLLQQVIDKPEMCNVACVGSNDEGHENIVASASALWSVHNYLHLSLAPLATAKEQGDTNMLATELLNQIFTRVCPCNRLADATVRVPRLRQGKQRLFAVCTTIVGLIFLYLLNIFNIQEHGHEIKLGLTIVVVSLIMLIPIAGGYIACKTILYYLYKALGGRRSFSAYITLTKWEFLLFGMMLSAFYLFAYMDMLQLIAMYHFVFVVFVWHRVYMLLVAALCALPLLVYVWQRLLSTVNKGKQDALAKDKSIFAQYNDEIINFFALTQYHIVIFDELDQFNNNELFSDLCALNARLNTARAIGRKITFIYAVNDASLVQALNKRDEQLFDCTL